MLLVFVWRNHNSPARQGNPIHQIGSVEVNVVNQDTQHLMQRRNRLMSIVPQIFFRRK